MIRIGKAVGPSPTSNEEKSRPQVRLAGADETGPANSVRPEQRGHSPPSAAPSGAGAALRSVIFGAPAAPHVDADEQEQPDHVDEVPVPGGCLEAEMLLGAEVAEIGADQAHG